jgi:hypothetical protein
VASGGSLVSSLAKTAVSYNGISLVLQAVTAASSLYFALTETKGPTLEASLSEQARLLGLVKDAYRDAADKAGSFYTQSKAIVTLQLEQNSRALQDNIRNQAGQFIGGNIGMRSDTDALGNSLGTGSVDIAEKYRGFTKEIQDFYASLGEGAPAVERFRDAVAGIGNANPALAKAAADLLAASQATGEAADRWKELQRAIRINNGTGTADDRAGIGLSNRTKAPARDPFDSQVVSINRHIAAMNADAAAVDQTAGMHAQLRVEAQLLEAAQQRGGTATAAQIAEMKRLGLAANDAATSLAKARVASEIKFGAATALLLPEDVAIARQLKDLYPDVATALGSVQAQAIRANSTIQQMGALGQDVNRSMVVQFGQNIRNGASAWDAFKAAGASALGTIADKLASMAADNLWKSAFGGTSGGFFSSLFGGAPGVNANGSITGAIGPTSVGGAPLVMSANGNAFLGGNVIPFARGGVVGGPTMTPMALMGEAGPEAIMPLSRGPGGKLGVALHGAGNDNGGPPVIMQDNRTIHIGAGASQEMVAQLKDAFARDRRERFVETVAIVKQAKQQRHL